MTEKTHWKQPVTKARLLEVLDYDELTGEFAWKVSRRCVKAGSAAGTMNSHGYKSIKVDGRLYTAHRLAWLWMTGDLPSLEVDHINRERLDNRFANLRLATSAQNKANRGPHPRNTSGMTGVSYVPSRGKFLAQISHNGKNHNLGRFDAAEDAIKAYRAAANRLHGDFQPTQGAL